MAQANHTSGEENSSRLSAKNPDSSRYGGSISSGQAGAEHFQQRAELLPLRNRDLRALALTVCSRASFRIVMAMLDPMNFLRVVKSWAACHNSRHAARPIAKDYAARGTAELMAAPVPHGWRRHGDAVFGKFSLTIEALRRKLRQPASSAVMIWIMAAARVKKYM
jgi:hypothetical protein